MRSWSARSATQVVPCSRARSSTDVAVMWGIPHASRRTAIWAPVVGEVALTYSSADVARIGAPELLVEPDLHAAGDPGHVVDQLAERVLGR